MICADDPPFALRHHLVTFARKQGIKAAARHFACCRNTVRKGLRRFLAWGNAGLRAQCRAPKSCPHKTQDTLEARVVALRKKTPDFGARRLIQEFGLPLGHNAVQRIINRHPLTRPPKRRHHRKNDLRAVKTAYAPFTRFQMEAKYHTDIPFYGPQMQKNGLPRFQYTLRELSRGVQFPACSNELSKTYATLAVERFPRHLQQYGIDTHQVVLTTDLGSEFDGDTVLYRPEGFPLTIEQRFNPPSCPNANADVENVHHTIEAELYDAQRFDSRADFFAKTATCQLGYNAADLLAAKAPNLSPKIFLLPPIPLESLLPKTAGHDVPGRAGQRRLAA